MSPYGKGQMPGMGAPGGLGLDEPPPPPRGAPPEPDPAKADAGGSSAEITCPTCGEKVMVTLYPAGPSPDEENAAENSAEGGVEEGTDQYQ